jgi:hypothetical protein
MLTYATAFGAGLLVTALLGLWSKKFLQDRKAVRLSLRVSVLESYIPALNKPECADLLTE